MSATEGGNQKAPDYPALQFKNFTFRYRAQAEPTLYDINLTIKRGEKILILGPSGSGKSTLLHCINGIIPQSLKGEITGSLVLNYINILNYDIFSLSKLIGTVLQDTDCQFVGLSAAEDIAFALENDCVPADEMKKRVTGAALLTDITAHLNKSPHDLSGGQKQRVSMAGVLVDNVDMLLFDEPLANLDPAAGKEAVELIGNLHKKTGKTIIIIEHRLEDILHRSVDRIITLDKGRVIADMSANELLASDILLKTGIREPLYIKALKYAGANIYNQDVNLEHIDALNIDYKPLIEWNNNQIKNNQNYKDENNNEEIILEAKDLRFRYTEHEEEALKGVSFSVNKGECASLIGKNGSGKSTLAKCVSGFIKPDSGGIFFNGADLALLSIKERAEKIGYVMQNPNQMISFPMIYDEAAFGLKNRGAKESEIKEKVYEALNACSLYPFRNWPVNALSYGQKKRLSIASILVLNPSFIILDEPTAGQDYRHYTEFMEFLLNLSGNYGISLMLITHDMHLMAEYTVKSIVLSDGECVAVKKPSEVLTDDEIIKKANLKRTSLYDLALKANLEDPRGFAERYIKYDRTRHGKK